MFTPKHVCVTLSTTASKRTICFNNDDGSQFKHLHCNGIKIKFQTDGADNSTTFATSCVGILLLHHKLFGTTSQLTNRNDRIQMMSRSRLFARSVGMAHLAQFFKLKHCDAAFFNFTARPFGLLSTKSFSVCWQQKDCADLFKETSCNLVLTFPLLSLFHVAVVNDFKALSHERFDSKTRK